MPGPRLSTRPEQGVAEQERQRHPLRALHSAQAPVPLCQRRPRQFPRGPVQFSGGENQKSGSWGDVAPTCRQTPKSAAALCLRPQW